MPRINFPTIGDIEDYEFLQGTIKTIDSSTDACTVDVDGSVVPALLFYHCLPNSELRENGAIQGSAAGFAVDDSVIVQIKYDKSVVRVVAHVDGVRACGFQIKLTRGDETPVDDSLLLSLNVYASNGTWVNTTHPYDPDTGYSKILFVNEEDGQDPLGYWVTYRCQDGLLTQYPYRYKAAEKLHAVDRIRPGSYEDVIPYWKKWTTENKAYSVDSVGLGTPYIQTLHVESSIPYTVTGNWNVPRVGSVAAHGQFTIPDASPPWMARNLAYSGAGTYPVNARHTLGGSDSCQVTGVGSAVNVTIDTPQSNGIGVVAYGGPGSATYEAKITDTSEFGAEIELWRMVNYVEETMNVPVSGFTSETSTSVYVGLNASYEN